MGFLLHDYLKYHSLHKEPFLLPRFTDELWGKKLSVIGPKSYTVGQSELELCGWDNKA